MKQQLSFFEILALCIGSIVGTGIFLIPGIVAGSMGPSTVLIWLAIAIFTIPMGFSFAELASMFSRSGGPVVFAKTAFGSFWGFIAGWVSWIVATVTISSLAIAISFYASFFIELGTMGRIALSVAAIAVLTLINYLGVKHGAKTQKILTGITVLLLLAFIIIGFPNVRMENFTPLFPLGLGALGFALLFALEPFIGWEACTIIAGEVRNSRKYVPKAIIITTLFIAALYMGIIFVALGAAGWDVLAASSAPLAEAVGGWALFIVVVSLVVNLASLNSWVFTTARLPYSLAKEKIFMKRFGRLSRYGTPGHSLIMQALLAGMIASTGNYELSIFLLLSAALILYAMCFLSLIKLRKSQKAIFRAPWFFPFISLFFVAFLLTQINIMVFVLGILITLLGVPGYIGVKIFTDKRFVENFWDRLYFVLDAYIPIFYRPHHLRHVLDNAKLRKGQTVLDYGCGTGRSTEEIVKRVRPGKVVAADLSKKQLRMTVRRVKKKKLPHVMLVKLSKPAPFPKQSFDRIVSTVAINYFIRPEKELRALHRTLKRRGIASFLALEVPGVPVHDFLRHDFSIKNSFKLSGFKTVKVEREKRIGREYIYITAKK
ncbi:MAG: amino acid permease [Candidatus Aenigmatarchaeota archaeon]